jgi:hypothetical protein
LRLRSYALSLFLLASAAGARANVALLLEEPFAKFGTFNPTGHAAVYLSGVCAASPVLLRRCNPGETGVVISRYYRVGGYDWLAIPLLPYLYAVDDPAEVPAEMDAKTEAALRDRYRREHLLNLVPDGVGGTTPTGDWIQLVGAAYDRTVYVLEMDSDEDQDDRFMATFNAGPNRSHFNLLFHNCAGFSSRVINSFYPHAVRRSWIGDAGLDTPKQAAKSLMRYGRSHADLRYRAFIVRQVPGTLRRSREVRGVLESLVSGPEYALPPLAFVNPLVAGGMALAYVARFVFHPGHGFPGDIGATLSPADVASNLAFDNRFTQTDYSQTDYRRQ